MLQSLDGRAPMASVPGEIVLEPESGHTWYDFDAKYIDGGGRADVPANIPEDVAERIQEEDLPARGHEDRPPGGELQQGLVARATARRSGRGRMVLDG